MAIARVQEFGSAAAANHTSAVGSVTNGDFLIAVAASGDAGGGVSALSISDDQSNTWVQLFSSSSTTFFFKVWYVLSAGPALGNTTVTATATDTGGFATIALSVLELSGTHPTSPIDVSQSATGASTSPNSGTTAAAKANDYVVGLIAASQGLVSNAVSGQSFARFGSPLASQTDETLRATAASLTWDGVFISDGPIAGPNTEAYSAIFSASQNWLGACVCLAPAVPAPRPINVKTATWSG